MAAPGRSCWVEESWLRQKDERMLWLPATRHLSFRRGNLSKGPAQMKRAGFPAYFARPGNRAAQCVVNFKYCRAIPKSLQPAPIARWKLIPGELEKLTWGQIQQDYARSW